MPKKLYKAVTPEKTVETIKKIISYWKLPVHEQRLGDNKDFFSCRIFLSNDTDDSIGTNGKGMNMPYAYASGYAEFMERLQNRVIVYPNPAAYNSSCKFFPDERPYHFNKEEIKEAVDKYLPTSIPDNGILADYIDGVSLPFYHVNKSSVEYLPYSLIRWINGSNGMSAGNIPEEALIQGFCEIFERYCMQQMYRRKIVPPSVPHNLFEHTPAYSKLEKLKEEYGMYYSIKDYSLGEGFPVIGLLLFNRDKSKYILHLGADLNPEIALERCYTEIFQGYTAETLKFENDVNDCERMNLFNEFKRSLMYGRGRQHENFFSGTPSYEYTGHTTISIGNNFSEDFNNICKWLIDKGYDIYIRDNSFMSFPTYHIVIPGLSEISSNFCNLNRRLFHMQLTENNLNPLYRLKTLNNKEISDTIQYLSMLDNIAIDLFPRNSDPANTVNRYILIALLNIKIGDNKSAYKSLIHYIDYCKSISRTPRPFFVELMNIFDDTSYSNSESKDFQLANYVIKHPDKIFDFLHVPNCFDCNNCKVAAECRYPLLEELEDKCQQAMAENIPNQSDLCKIMKI